MSDSHSHYNDRVIAEFRASGGTVGRFGRSLVLLHHVGAKSGIERVAPVMGIHTDHDSWLVAASKAGADTHPAWYYNLLAHPEITIETADDGIVAVLATNLVGEERDAAWAKFTTSSDGFRSYETRTSRTIPVLDLVRR